MNDLLLHELGARRIHWRYDDPSGVPDLPARTVRATGRPVRRGTADVRARIAHGITPKAA